MSIILTSCDAEHVKDYYVKNKLDSTVVFKFTLIGKIDSVKLVKDEEQLIHIDTYYNGQVGVEDNRENDHVNNLKIRYDSIEKKISENLWTYEETDEFHAIYRLKIDSNLIE